MSDTTIKKLNTANVLLNDFNTGLKNEGRINIQAVMFPEGIFEDILDWHSYIHKQESKYLHQDKNIKYWSEYQAISSVLDDIFKNISTNVLQDKSGSKLFPFFKTFKKHTELNRNNLPYLNNLFDIFSPIFFDNVEKYGKSFDIWGHEFPNKWKVTIENLEDKQNNFARIWLNEFLKWGGPKILNPVEHNMELDGISRNLFPTIDPITWARYLIFTFGHVGKDRVKSVIKRDWNFGFIGQMHVGNHGEDFGKIQKNFEENAIDFISYFNSKVINGFNKETLKKYLNELESLQNKYAEESKEERHRVRLHFLIKELIERM